MLIYQDFILDGLHNKPIVADITYISDGLPKPVIIFAHGFKGFKDWGAWSLIGQQFAQAGFVFLKFNFSHNGTTPTQPTNFADLEAFGNNNYSIELDDLNIVIDSLFNLPAAIEKSEIDTSQIYLIGHSRGGGIAILKAYEDARIKKLATWAAVKQLNRNWSKAYLAQWKKQGVVEVFNGRTKQHMPLYWQLAENFLANKSRLCVSKATKQLAIPFLIAHGNADPAVPIQDAYDLHDWNLNAKLLLLENANHVFGTRHPWMSETLPPHAQILVQETIAFFK